MDFLSSKKRRNHRIRLYIGYILMGIAIFLASVILVFRSYGYDLDRSSGEVIQRGLVFVGSQPDGMDIYLDDGLVGSRTSARLHLPSRVYKLQLKKQGYRTWERSFELEGGSVKRFSYPMLFPEDIKTSIVTDISTAPPIFSSTPDRRWMLVNTSSAQFNFQVFSIDQPTVSSRNIVLPSTLVTTPSKPGLLKIAEWSNDNRHVLLQRTYDDKKEYYLLDINRPELSVNITRTFNTQADDIRLIDKRADRFYLLTSVNGTLQTADLRSVPQSQPLLSGVTTYKSYGDNIVMYATTVVKDGLTTTQVRIQENGSQYLLHEYENAGPFSLDVARFNSKWYYVIGNTADNRALIFIDPVDKLKANPTNKIASPDTFLPVQNVQFVSFSANVRFIAAQSGHNLAIYDNELREKYTIMLDESVRTDIPAKWMDGHRFAVVSKNKVVVMEFDGNNKQILVDSSSAELVFDTEYKALYTIIPTQTEVVSIQRAELRLP